MVSLTSLPARSLRFHWRGNLAVALGIALAAAVLSGALFVGDSLRASLRERAERQLNGITASWTGSRLIHQDVASRLTGTIPALLLKGSVASENLKTGDSVRLPGVTVLGMNSAAIARFDLPRGIAWDKPEALTVLSQRLATRLGVQSGERVRLSVQQFSSVPRSSLLGRRSADDTTSSMTLTVSAVLPADHPASDFSLFPNPALPMTMFVPLSLLQERQKQAGRINSLLAFESDARTLNTQLSSSLGLDDLGLQVKLAPARKAYVSVEADQLVLDSAMVDATISGVQDLGLRAEPTAVYLANRIEAGSKLIPYSVIAALNPNAGAPLGPFLPAQLQSLKDEEIVLADWDESPLKDVPLGSTIRVSYFKPEIETGAEETSAEFKLAGRVPLAGPAADPDLTPPFPGITDKLSIGDWNPPFPFDRKLIKPRDHNERFWDKYKTTPKAYITLAAGERLFRSRFGVITSIRIAPAANEFAEQTLPKIRESIRVRLRPEDLGIAFEDTRTRLKEASKGGTDFGGLFLGFSLFLIVSSLLFVAMLFRLNIEKRAKEMGTLLATGYSPRIVLKLLLVESLVIALLGSLLGVFIGVGYAHLLVRFLTELWPDRSVVTFLRPHATFFSASIAYLLTVIMSIAAIVLAVRALVRVSPPALLRGVTEEVSASEILKPRRNWLGVGIGLLIVGIGSIYAGTLTTNPDFRALGFFLGGGAILIAGCLMIHRWLQKAHGLPRQTGTAALLSLGPRNLARSVNRSLLTVFLLATATFLLVAVESFRRKPDQDFDSKQGGSGGFNLIAEADVPLFQPFDQPDGRGDLLDSLQRHYQEVVTRNSGGPDVNARLKEAEQTLNSITASVPLRSRGGDDASCLNLYQAAKPRLIGVPNSLIERGGFKFYASQASTDAEKANPWLLLQREREDGAIPVFAEQNTAMYMLKVGLGGEVAMTSEEGKPIRCRIVATLVDSPFQSELLMADTNFRKHFPRDEGFRLFLIDTPSTSQADIIRLLQTGFADNGLSVTSIRDRVANFQAVIGTYLTTFQLLGGLGLIFGVLGLGVVILRTIFERTGELALLRAFGYTPGDLRIMLLGENAILLLLGVFLGLSAALISVTPHLLLGGQLPWRNVLILVVAVGIVGGLVVVYATRAVNRIPILTALRNQ